MGQDVLNLKALEHVCSNSLDPAPHSIFYPSVWRGGYLNLGQYSAFLLPLRMLYVMLA